MIAAVALFTSLSASSLQASPTRELVDAWQTYWYAEYQARGGYKCDRHERRMIAGAFDRRFAKRVAVLRNMVVKQLGKAEAESGFDVILTCERSKPAVFADPSWSRTYFDHFQAALLTAETAFGARRREP